MKVESNMEYFQSVFKHRKMVLAGVILACVLGLGCSTHKAENMAEPEAGQEQIQESEAPLTDNMLPTVEAVSVMPEAENVTIEIRGTGPMAYTSIKQAFPFGIAVYLPDTVMADGLAPVNVENPDVSGVRVGYADDKKTTVKVEIFLTRDLPYAVEEGEHVLAVVIQNDDANKDMIAQAASGQLNESDIPPAAAAKAVEPTGNPAALTHIEFDTAPSGRSDIRVKTSQPVKYEARQTGEDRIDLVLFNTRIPDIHKRPLLTQYFNSAVEEVQPKAAPGNSPNAHIAIKIREQVPYQLVQTSAGIHMAFEPSSITPPQFAKARINTGQPDSVESNPMPQQEGADAALLVAETSASPADMFSDKPPVYTGEKIKLDFYDTDIKNVFRILRSVSGLNFAIDDDVQGKVTMSLEEPVPWDQVMDLVLKMNGLGKKIEGNVVRIATLETMAAEEKSYQDAITARKKSLEQKQSLEPMVTEYIPINYSDATSDIQPHVQKILTPDRGRLSVDSRTNMVIITDTQTKIDQAQELIYRLDTVTPQIMIEARVVEVTKDFSRSLGMAWNLSNASSATSGFADDFGVAINQSATAGISGEFSFFSLFGSSVTALNAQLEAAEETGDSKIISSPRVLTLDNKTATITQGFEYAYQEESSSGGTTTSFKDIDLSLEVTPHVTPDKRISMKVSLTKNDVFSVTTTGVPTLATNETETELLVNDNETVVIGGVVKTSKTDDDSGLPFLTGIPVLGKLFGISKEEESRSELLIFITPSIVQLPQKKNLSRAANQVPGQRKE
jgi:type IV pilus assembly protein PilQ